MKIKENKRSDGKIDLTITCDICGEPITHSNKYGMFCDKECDLEKSKAVDKEFDELAKFFDSF